MEARLIKYEIEQLFPSSKDRMKPEWYSTGEDYDNKKEALDRLKELKDAGRSGVRVIRKTMLLEIIQTI